MTPNGPAAERASHGLSDAVVAARLAAVRNAVGSVRLAGLEPDAATVADMEGVARGERTFEQARATLLARITAERRTRGDR